MAFFKTLVSLNGYTASYGGLTLDANGDLFGTTTDGGQFGGGTVFEIPLTNTGYAATLTTLVSFNGSNNGPFDPSAGLTADANGNLFGLTTQGGQLGAGAVFEIPWTGTAYATPITLVNFLNQFGHPQAGLLVDSSGNLFDTTSGVNTNGSVFELAPNGTGYSDNLWHVFTGFDGASPQSKLIADANGDLFGTTFYGGPNYDPNLPGASGLGTVFELVKGGNSYTFKTLVNFGTDITDIVGAYPTGLTVDALGNLFGTTEIGTGVGLNPYGDFFELKNTPNGYIPVLLAQGIDARGSPIGDANGDLFVMDHFGQLWELPKTDSGYGSPVPLLNPVLLPGHIGGLAGTFDGSGGLTADANGNLFGTTTDGGTNNTPSVFEITNTGFTHETVTSVSVFHAPPIGFPASSGSGDLGIGSQVAFWVYFSAPVFVSLVSVAKPSFCAGEA
jgi:hypothetical protein